MSALTLTEIDEKYGINRRTIQGYEKEGLVSSSGKNKYGYLLYDDLRIEQIRNIKKHQEFGFTLKEIKRLFRLPDVEYQEAIRGKIVDLKKAFLFLEHSVSEMKKLLK